MKFLNNLYILLGTVGIMGVLVMDLISVEFLIQSADCIKDSTEINLILVEEEQINPVKLMFLPLIYLTLYTLRI
jgi:hypothetical protein